MYKDLETGEGTEFKHYQLCYIVIHCIPIYATYYTFKKNIMLQIQTITVKVWRLKGSIREK